MSDKLRTDRALGANAAVGDNPPTNDNPLFYRTIVRETNPNFDPKVDPPERQFRDRTVIHSMLDRLYVGQKIPNSGQYVEQIKDCRNLTINALELELIGPIAIPSGDVRICCRKLIVPASGDSDTPGAVIDVSPPPLPPNYEKPFAPKDQLDHAPGADGDTIAALLQKGQGIEYCTQPDASAYLLHATAGADAGTITIVCDEIALAGELQLNAVGGKGYSGCNGQKGGPAADLTRGIGGKGGKGGRGGTGGKGGTITLRYRKVDNQGLLTWYTTAGDPGAHGERGAPGEPRGERGAASDPGETRGDGKVDEDNGIDLQELGSLFDDVYLRRLVQKCKQTYLFNQPTRFTGDKVSYPDEWTALGNLLDWTTAVLAGYAAEPEKTAPLEKLRKNSLYQGVHNMLLSYQGGLTYDNSSPDWVPSTPLKTMIDNFNIAFAQRKKLETRFLALSAKFESAKDAQRALDDARTEASKAKALHKDMYDALYSQLTTELPLAIATARAVFAKAKQRVHDELKTFEATVSTHFHWCTLADVLKAAETLAFTAGDPKAMAAMGGVEVASMVNEGLTKLPNNQGQSIAKSELMDEIVAVDGDLEKVSRGELFDEDPDTHKMVFKPGKKMLVTQIGKLKDEIANFSKELGNDATDPVVKALDDFTEALFEQGQALILYNVLAARMVDEYRSYTRADAEAEALDTKADPLSPGWVGNVSYFSKLYQDELEATVAAVCDLQRKAAYVTLDYQTPTDWLKAMGSLWLDGGTPPSDDMDLLGKAVNDLYLRIGSYASGQPSASKRIPATETMRSDLFVDITAGPLLEEFKQRRKNVDGNDDGYMVTFTIVPGTPKSSRELAVSNSSKLFDIRVVAVQPRLIGAKSRQGKVSIEAQVAARTSMLSENGDKHTFYMRRSRSTGVVHDVNTSLDGKSYDDSGSGSGGKLTDDFLDRIGLFGKWKLWCPEPVTKNDDNDQLDVSGVTQIRIYFDVYAYHKSIAAPL